MSPNQVVDQAKTKFNEAVDHFKEELKRLRTGRANASMLDGVTVEAYGTPMPLNQVATVSAPEAQLLQITPFDPNNLQAISAAIRDNQSLGLNPSDDGRVVRVTIPALTEERRREISKQVGGKLEECMVRMRSVRHDALDTFEQAKKDKDISEDDEKRYVGQVEEAMTKTKADAEAAAKAKEQEIMTV
ncbi:ribosome recycling factor [Candidatus Saccharibacteria bacterium]|nr:MAG: ribosome recycling factor [Candidatus Saccharibacteria bacterium]